MQFISSLLGGSSPSLMTTLFGLGIVLVLIVLAVWVLKLIFNASSTVARGRNRRLSLVDSLALDPKRSLIIVRRDNVEHLLLVGGPHDMVVETGIAVEETTTQPTRRPLPTAPGRRAAPGSAMQKLRDLGTEEPDKPSRALRYPGLARPSEPAAGNTDISAPAPGDSATHESVDPRGSGDIADTTTVKRS